MLKRRRNEVFMKQDPIARFISRLETLGGIASDPVPPDRRAFAALRRSLATWPVVPPEAVRVVAPFLHQQATGWWEDVYYIIAALFAMHPCLSSKETGRGPSLAKALHEAASGDSGKGPERRLLALLGCKSEDLPTHLRHVVSYLSARKISIDYLQLMRDLSWWDSGEGKVQRRWGRDFWSGTFEENQESAESVAEEK
jgi:CRISPR type I-E-associated protein CasB/Cse2